jgi:hypothetical protein
MCQSVVCGNCNSVTPITYSSGLNHYTVDNLKIVSRYVGNNEKLICGKCIFDVLGDEVKLIEYFPFFGKSAVIMKNPKDHSSFLPKPNYSVCYFLVNFNERYAFNLIQHDFVMCRQ